MATCSRNPAVARQYEPGSVMKAFTVAAALDAGAITTTDTVVDDNNLQIGNVRIHNADRADHPYGHGPITAGDVLALSNNVGAAKIGLTLGGDRAVRGLPPVRVRRADRHRPCRRGQRRGLASGRRQRIRGPDRRPERLRPGPQPDRRPAGRRLRLVRQRRAAGDAARRRGLDRSRRHVPRRGAAARPSGSCGRRRPRRWSSC